MNQPQPQPAPCVDEPTAEADGSRKVRAGTEWPSFPPGRFPGLRRQRRVQLKRLRPSGTATTRCLICLCLLLLNRAWGGVALGETLRGDVSVLGQARDGDQSTDPELPVQLYGLLGADRLLGVADLDTYFRLERDFRRNDNSTDLYAASARGAWRGIEASLGRQFLSEVPGGAFVADAGRLRFSDPSWPVTVSVFGGQPRYYEPTNGAENLSQDEQVVGASLRTARFTGGNVGLGFLHEQRDGRALRQLLSLTGNYTLAQLTGVPSFYGAASLDAKRQNIDFANAGVQLFFRNPRVAVNFESGYYNPQDQTGILNDPARREDPIFELFSISEMLRFRGGLRYAVLTEVSLYTDYSYQRYERLRYSFADGHLGSAGVIWLPGGDGLERVRLEYYAVDGPLGRAEGGRLLYDNFVYERIVLRTKLDVTDYNKRSNRSDTAVSSRVGIGYEILGGLIAEVSFEANHNARFDEDLRVGFFVSYNFRRRDGGALEHADSAAQPLPGGQPS